MAFLLFPDKTRTDLDRLSEGNELLYGSSYDCDILAEADGVAPKHLVFLKKNDAISVRPFSGKTEITLNEQMIDSETALKHGDHLDICGEVIQYLEKEPEEESVEERRDRLKLKLHGLLLERMDLKRLRAAGKTDSGLAQKAQEVISGLVDEFESEFRTFAKKEEIYKEILDEAVGLGALEDFLADPDVTEIMVKGYRNIYIERRGKITLTGRKFLSEEQLIGVIERIVAPLGRRIDESSPLVDARLKDGSRVNAVIPPVALDGAALTIRKFSKTPFGIADLIKFGSMTEEIARIIQLAVEFRQNVVISGGTGSGKTTLLNVSSSFIPDDERIVTIEDSAELQLPQDHVIRMETRPPNIEGKGRISIRDLVINSLRMRPDRIVVGECRGGEALDMLQAMNTGHDGSLTTVHSNAPRDCLARLETLVLMAGMDLPSRAIREQIAMAVNVIVQQARLADGSRKITHVTEVTGIDDGFIKTEDIFVFKQTGLSEDGKVLGHHVATGYVPRFVSDLTARGIAMPMEIFDSETNGTES